VVGLVVVNVFLDLFDRQATRWSHPPRKGGRHVDFAASLSGLPPQICKPATWTALAVCKATLELISWPDF